MIHNKSINQTFYIWFYKIEFMQASMSRFTISTKYTLSLIAFLLFANSSFAQLQSYKKGLASFEKGEYDLAIKELAKVSTIAETEKGNLHFKIAEAYRQTNRWVEAIPFYEKAIEAKVPNQDILFHYAFALKAAARYTDALNALQKFIDAKSSNKVYNEKAYRELNTLKIIGDVAQKKNELEFKNLSTINTKGAEFSPVVRNGEFIFTSSRKDKIYSNGLPFLGIYKSKIGDTIAELGKVEAFSASIYDVERNEGSLAFSPDGKTIVFARGNTGKRKDLSPDVDLYLSRFVTGSGWTEPKLVSASDSASWDGSPCFSRDGKTIYFASNRAGGSGGIDLYRVNMDASGRFGNPANMGKDINTAGDEMFPYVSAEGKLYFASDGHPGLGKLDLFVAVRANGKITVENLGLPYNSSMDDFALSMDEEGNQFFCSNRAGGVGDDDIYYYKAPKKETIAEIEKPLNPEQIKQDSINKALAIKTVNYYLAGKIQTKNEENQLVLLDSVHVRILEAEFEQEIAQFTTSNTGTFGPIALKENTDYIVIADKKDFLTKREDFSMYGRSIPQQLLKKALTDTTFYTNLTLDKVFIGKTFRLENIYYDLDKFDIRPDAAIELNKLVQVLNDNPNLKIELGSHTDSRATEVYNLRLSQKRAESAINYIVSKGIDRSRLTAKGYGESELIIENAKTEEEHQINRRTEFKVLEIE